MKISRKILFYNVIDPDKSVMNLFRELSNVSEEDMYLPYPDDNRMLFVTIVDSEKIVKGKINYFKASDFPTAIKKNSSESYPLPLSEEEGLCNSTHFIYYPDSQIIAIEFNSNGPRINALKDYLDSKIKHDFEYNFSPIMRTDLMEELRRVREVKLFDIKISTNSLPLAKYFDGSIFEALENAQKIGGSETVEIKISAGRKKGGFLKMTPIWIKERFEAMKRDNINPVIAFETLKIKGTNVEAEGVELIDLLKQWTFGQVTVTKLGKGREVESTDMFNQINHIYELLSPSIKSL